MKYQLTKNHSKANARSLHECKICYKVFQSVYFLPEQKREEHAAQRGSAAQNFDVTQLVRDVDDCEDLFPPLIWGKKSPLQVQDRLRGDPNWFPGFLSYCSLKFLGQLRNKS